MASSMKTTQSRDVVLAVVGLLLAAATRAAGAGSCEGEKFPAGRSYATCADLPTLGATLHWTYDAAASALSVAFVAKPAADGWVSWAINPTGDEMKGAQALVAFKQGGDSSSVYVVNTYNITGYEPFPAASTPIAFNSTDLAADESGGKVRLYGKLQLPQGMDVVNHIWQVGSTVTGGAPIKHALAEENMDSKGKLVLTGHGAQEPSLAPLAGGPSAESEEAEASPEPSHGKSPSPASSYSPSAASAYSPSPALILLALAGFLVFV
ncbi:hypothetical protein GUJ93_ZPchr0002g24086 [Zizania palustris]|uniref:DOMON domain-containing protein n=1 Tax=Zizania palustris TaxID=103762 RepID=A0A8J5SG32_ZIZPA|nr:hypothetical protein GUJ93_ZPchr0002g24086 [Zizania palustris]